MKQLVLHQARVSYKGYHAGAGLPRHFRCIHSIVRICARRVTGSDLPCRPPRGGLATDAVSPAHPPHLVSLPGHVQCRPVLDGQAPPPGAQTSHDIIQHFTDIPVTVHVPRGMFRDAFSVLFYEYLKNIIL